LQGKNFNGGAKVVGGCFDGVHLRAEPNVNGIGRETGWTMMSEGTAARENQRWYSRVFLSSESGKERAFY